MPSFNLSQDEKRIVEFFLFGDPPTLGLLDWGIIANTSQTARMALEQNPALDVVQWVRDNPQEWPIHGAELAATWWIWKHDGVNVTPPQRPPEAPTWVMLLQNWDQSITRGFSKRTRDSYNGMGNQRIKALADEVALPVGDYLAAQQPLLQKAISILGG